MQSQLAKQATHWDALRSFDAVIMKCTLNRRPHWSLDDGHPDQVLWSR